MENERFAYIKLYEKLREEITKGAYAFGDKLPSKRALAETSGTSVITVRHAYNILCDEGYVESKERKGYFVIYSEKDSFPVAKKTVPAPYVHRGISEDFPFSAFAKTVRRVLSCFGEEILEKSPASGVLRLREAVSKYLARSRGIFVSPENILIGAGAEYFYSLLVQALGRDTVFGLENPSYEKIRKVYEGNGAECRMLKMSGDGILSKELIKTDAKALHITPFNSFPSGITATASKRREYIRWANQKGAIIIEDDFDSEFSGLTKREDTVFSLSENGNVIYMNTFSKTIAPSIRMGYMVIPDRLMPQFEEKIGFYSCTVSVLEQLIVSEFIESGDFERHLNRIRRKRAAASLRKMH